MRVHSALGPGLLENAYEVCLHYELVKSGLCAERQIALPLVYDDHKLDAGNRLDLVVEQQIVLKLKAVENLLPIHTARLISYLRLGNFPLGNLPNFHSQHMRHAVKRIINHS